MRHWDDRDCEGVGKNEEELLNGRVSFRVMKMN